MSVEAVNQWTRLLGVTLRPWAGHAPLSLILRGLIHLAVCAFLIVVFIQMAGVGASQDAGTRSLLRGFLAPAVIVLAVLAVSALARIVLGVLDLAPREQVTGIVTSMRERKVGDLLPLFLQRAIFERNPLQTDRRRHRAEVVLSTDRGERQWTVRSRKLENQLQPGAHVRISVSPLVGYVAEVAHLDR